MAAPKRRPDSTRAEQPGAQIPAAETAAPTPLLPDHALVPVAPRQDGWTPDRQRAFIEALADTGSVKTAALSVGMTAESAYRLRRRADAKGFDAAWEAALERVMDSLVAAAVDRALNGSLRQRWYHGEVVAEEQVHHDRLLIYLLGKGGAMLRHQAQRRRFGEDWDGALGRMALGEPIAPEPSPYVLERNGLGEWITDCPPPPGFRGPSSDEGPGEPGYWRCLTPEERRGLMRRQEGDRRAQEALRRRLFGLDEPGQDDAKI